MGIVEVVGGVDTHADFHVAAAVDANGGLLDVERFPANAEGYECLLAWLAELGQVTRVGVEGTGSYGVGLARFLIDAEVEVVEVDRQNRQVRSKKGKSDPTDAATAARAALSVKHLSSRIFVMVRWNRCVSCWWLAGQREPNGVRA